MVPRKSFTVKEVAQRNGISHVSVYEQINQGRLQSFKIGKCRRITVEAEQAWIQAQEAEAGVA